MQLVLRGYFRSSCSWRVRIGLHWKQLDYLLEPVHLVRGGGEQHGDSHRAANPMEQVPVLFVDGEPVTQSVAILELLEELAPTPPLLPADAVQRARVRQMVEVVNSGIQPLQNLATMQRLSRDFGADKAQVAQWSGSHIDKGFRALEAMAARWSGRFSVCDEVSLADVFLVPQLFNARRFSVDLAHYPTLTRIEQALLALPSFHETRPEAQPDAEA
jgi:maleylpyruvate isomerase